MFLMLIQVGWIHTIHAFSPGFLVFFLTPSPGILARSPGILAPSPGVEFLRLYFWISLGLVAPIAMRNFTQAAAKKILKTSCVLTLWKKKHIFQLNDACTSNCTCPFRNCVAKVVGVHPSLQKKQLRKKTIPTRTPELCQIEMAGCKKQWKASS